MQLGLPPGLIKKSKRQLTISVPENHLEDAALATLHAALVSALNLTNHGYHFPDW